MSLQRKGAYLPSTAKENTNIGSGRETSFLERQLISVKSRMGERLSRLFIYVLLIGIAFVCVFPLLYVAVVSLMSNADLSNPAVQWIPSRLQFENYYIALDILNYRQFARNSLLVTVFATVGHLLSCSMIGYGFARFRFPFRNILFLFVILAFIVPVQTIIVPMYLTFLNFGWINSYRSLLVPTFFGFGLNGALFIFIFRQFFLTLPPDLENAAKIDGAGFLHTYVRIVFPLARSALVVVLVLSVVWHWNNFYEPSIYLRDPRLGFLPARIQTVIGAVNAPPEELFERLGMVADGEDTLTNAVVMAGTALIIAPVLIFFVFAQRAFMQGIERTGITGE